jgi:hypothetical protein
MLAQGVARLCERNPGIASGENGKPRRGDRTFAVCRPSGASIHIVNVSQGLLAFGSLHPGLTSHAPPGLKASDSGPLPFHSHSYRERSEPHFSSNSFPNSSFTSGSFVAGPLPYARCRTRSPGSNTMLCSVAFPW